MEPEFLQLIERTFFRLCPDLTTKKNSDLFGGTLMYSGNECLFRYKSGYLFISYHLISILCRCFDVNHFELLEILEKIFFKKVIFRKELGLTQPIKKFTGMSLWTYDLDQLGHYG